MQKRGILHAVLLSAAVVLAAVVSGRLKNGQSGAEAALVREAVKNAALSCYAVEGAYPAELSYLMENYGLTYNEEQYIVSYDAFAENLFPDIRVLERGRH